MATLCNAHLHYPFAVFALHCPTMRKNIGSTMHQGKPMLDCNLYCLSKLGIVKQMGFFPLASALLQNLNRQSSTILKNWMNESITALHTAELKEPGGHSHGHRTSKSEAVYVLCARNFTMLWGWQNTYDGIAGQVLKHKLNVCPHLMPKAAAITLLSWNAPHDHVK